MIPALEKKADGGSRKSMKQGLHCKSGEVKDSNRWGMVKRWETEA